MKLLLTLLLLCFLYGAATAQEQDSVNGIHRIDIGVSIASYSSLDQLASPLQYHSTTVPIVARYQYEHPNLYQDVFFSCCVSGGNASPLTPATVATDHFNKGGALADLECYYSYLRTCFDDSTLPIKIQVGATLDNIGSLRRYKYFGDDFYSPGGIITWDAASMLQATASIGYDPTTSLHGKVILSVPLISAIIRPPFDFFHTESIIIQGSDGHIVVIGGMAGYRFSVGLDYDIGKHLTVGIQYISRYFRYERYSWVSSWIHQGGLVTLGWRI